MRKRTRGTENPVGTHEYSEFINRGVLLLLLLLWLYTHTHIRRVTNRRILFLTE